MSILDKVKATRPNLEKPRYKVRNGKIVIRIAAVLAEKKPASQKALRMKLKEKARQGGWDASRLVEGARCPKCRGTGKWTNPTTGDSGVCFWCNDPRIDGPGKGFLNRMDIAYIQQRDGGGGPINYGLSA